MKRSRPNNPKLSPEHLRKYIKGSGIDPDVASQRGYRTVADKVDRDQLRKLGFWPSQIHLPGILIPVWSVTGERAGWQLRPDNPPLDRLSGRELKYQNLPGSRGRLDLHPCNVDRLGDGHEPLWITEGIRKGDAGTSQGLLIISLFGVWNWRGTDESGALRRLPDWEEITLKGRPIYIVFDSDVMTKMAVQLALERLGHWLEMKEADVQYVYLNDDEDGTRQGLDDFFVAGGTVDELTELATDTLRGLPTISVQGHQLRESTQDVLDSIVDANDPPQVFRWAGSIARIRDDYQRGPFVEPFDVSTLRDHMSGVADYVQYRNSKRVNVWPVRDLAAQVLARPDWPDLPRLEGLIQAPTLRPDGTILDAPGFDEATGLVYIPSPDLESFTVPDHPTLQQCKKALAFLHEPIRDFPFETQPDRANFLGFHFTPVLRHAISGGVPMADVTAPAQGSGKTMAVKIVGITATGREPELRAIPRDEEEWRKSIISALRPAPEMVVYDNLNWKLMSSALAKALTAGSSAVVDRGLGTMDDIVVNVRTTWAITNNNMDFATDLLRRSYQIRLVSRDPHPEDRDLAEYHIPNLLPWVTEHRRQLLLCILTLARAWYEAGQPAGEGPILANYEEWSRIIGGILTYAGVKGFLGNIEKMRNRMDTDANEWGPFVAAWRLHLKTKGWRTGKVYDELVANAKFRAALPSELAEAFEKSSSFQSSSFPKVLGHQLKKRMDRVYRHRGKDYMVRLSEDTDDKSSWRVIQLGRDEEEPE